jgi:hypothetical protein
MLALVAAAVLVVLVVLVQAAAVAAAVVLCMVQVILEILKVLSVAVAAEAAPQTVLAEAFQVMVHLVQLGVVHLEVLEAQEKVDQAALEETAEPAVV